MASDCAAHQHGAPVAPSTRYPPGHHPAGDCCDRGQAEGTATVNGFGDPEALPVTYVVDAEGVVRGKLRADGAPVTRESLEQLVAPLLAGAAASRGP